MSGMSDDESFPLLPAKHMKTTNWQKCIICQTGSNLRKAGDEGIATFVTAAKRRSDEVYQRLQPVIDQLHTMEPVWHRAC